MTPSIRNTAIYLLVAACTLMLASRIVTVVLLLMHAPEDAEQYFYLQQAVISVACVGAIIWLWGKRVRDDRQPGGD